MTWPPWGAVTSNVSRRVFTAATTEPGTTVAPGSERVKLTTPLAGAMTNRQVGLSAIWLGCPCSRTMRWASESWSGDLRARTSTPGSPRLARLANAPAGGISIRPVTPRSLNVSMHRSQRTGLLIWVTRRLRTSRPLCTTVPSRLDTRRERLSWVEIARAMSPIPLTAEVMCSVWKAPAGAFHTEHMAAAVKGMGDMARAISTHDSRSRLVSNRDGTVVHSGREVLNRLVTQISSPVRWDLCMETFKDLGVTGLIEIPPAGALANLAKRGLPGVEVLALKSPDQLSEAHRMVREHGQPNQIADTPTWRLVI